MGTRTKSTCPFSALDDRPVRDDGALGHDDDAVDDAVALGRLGREPPRVDEPDAVADAGVLVDDGLADLAIAADADVGDAPLPVAGYGLAGFIVIGAHDDRPLEPGVLADPRADADDGLADAGAVDDAAFAQDGVLDVGAEDLGAGQ